jgi:glycerol-3-phosphate O-acyltransferase
MLGSPRHAMDAQRLAEQVDLLRELLGEVPYSARQVVTPLDGAAVIEHARASGMVQVVAHPLGDIVKAPARQAARLAYFRNNVLHAFALPSLVACLVSRNQRIDEHRVLSIARQLLPFLRGELFLSWRDDELPGRLESVLAFFGRRGLVSRADGVLEAPAPTQHESVLLHALAHVVRQPLERYYIAVRTLVRFGPASLSPQQLEEICSLLAQRVAFLHESGSPDFTDRTSFRSIVRTLIEIGMAEEVSGRLHFGDALRDGADDADRLLPEDTVLAIAHAAQLSPEEIQRASAKKR